MDQAEVAEENLYSKKQKTNSKRMEWIVIELN